MADKKTPMYHRKGRYKHSLYAYSLPVSRELVSVAVPAEIREQLEAIAYMRGMNGIYAPVAREALRLGIRQILANMDPEDRKMLDERILPNVKINREIFRTKRREHTDEINRSIREENKVYYHDDETKFIADLPELPDLDEDDEVPAP